MKRGGLVIPLLLIVWLLSGCSAASAVARLGDAQKVADGYFDAIKTKDYDKALSLYGPRFFERVSRDEWATALQQMNDRFGELQKYDLGDWKVRNRKKDAPEGSYYLLEYETKYAKDTSVVQVMTLFEPRGTQGFQIIGHEVNSEGLFIISHRTA